MSKQITVYVPRVRDTGPKPQHEGSAFRVKTHANPAGQYGTRKRAEQAIKDAIANDSSLARVGVGTEKITKAPSYKDWLTGDVKPPASVPAKYRPAYLDTLERATLAAVEYGHAIYVSESFRTREQQEAFWDIYQHGGSLAARPGTSPHEKGIALDIPNARTNKKLIKALRKHNLIDDVKSEIWHVTNHGYKG